VASGEASLFGFIVSRPHFRLHIPRHIRNRNKKCQEQTPSRYLLRVLLRTRYSTWVLSCALRLRNSGRNTDRRSRRIHLFGQTKTGKCILCPVDSTEAFGRGGQTPISDDVARRRRAFSVVFGDVKGLDEGTDCAVRAKVFFPPRLSHYHLATEIEGFFDVQSFIPQPIK